MYEAIDITYRAGDKTILRNASVAVKPGRFTAIVGPNGAGKSSLLKVLSHEQRAHSGKVMLNGKSIRKYKPKELSRVRSVLAQHSNLQFAFTVSEVIALSRQSHSTSRDENAKLIEEVMEATGTLSLAERNYLTLSGGEKQRVQLARVLAQVWDETLFPRYVLLDEPTSSMDIAQQQSMFSTVKKICSRNIGVLAIVHDLNVAAQFADYIYMMNKGQVVGSGTVAEVFTKQNIEHTFCCKVNVYHDPCNNCPFIIPEAEGMPVTQIASIK